jgi:hypothetical protein
MGPPRLLDDVLHIDLSIDQTEPGRYLTRKNHDKGGKVRLSGR